MLREKNNLEACCKLEFGKRTNCMTFHCFLNITKIIPIVVVAKKTVSAKANVLSQKLKAKIKTISPNPNPRAMLVAIWRLKRINTNLSNKG